MNCDGTEEEIDKYYELFNCNVPYPNGANLFFYPENYNPENDDISTYNHSVEEIIEKVLSYKPIQL